MRYCLAASSTGKAAEDGFKLDKAQFLPHAVSILSNYLFIPGKQSLLRGAKVAEGVEKLVCRHQRQATSGLGKCRVTFEGGRKESLPGAWKRQMQNKFAC